jgi:hypothetical protein
MCLVLERQRRMRNNLFVLNDGLYLKVGSWLLDTTLRPRSAATPESSLQEQATKDRMTGFQTPQPV